MKPEDIKLRAEYLEYRRQVLLDRLEYLENRRQIWNHHKEDLEWLRRGLILMPIFWAIIMLAMVLVMYK